MEIEVPISSAPVGESSSMAATRQHSDDLENPVPTKRARATAIELEGRIMPLPPPLLQLDDDVQCAYYAIELLRVSWKASHASGILLKGKCNPHSQLGLFIFPSARRTFGGSLV